MSAFVAASLARNADPRMSVVNLIVSVDTNLVTEGQGTCQLGRRSADQCDYPMLWLLLAQFQNTETVSIF